MLMSNTKIVFRVGCVACFLLFFLGCTPEKKSGEKHVSDEKPNSVQGSTNTNKLLYAAYQKRGGGYNEKTELLVEQYREALLGRLFWEEYQSSRITVSMDEIRSHYIKNKHRFKRATNQLRVLSFLLNTLEEAVATKEALSLYNPTIRATTIKKHKASPRTISPGSLPQEVDALLFSKNKSNIIVGPVESKFGFHVFEVLDFFPADSFVGLDEVYDDVSQEIYRKKRGSLFSSLLDSLTKEHKTLGVNDKTKEEEE